MLCCWMYTLVYPFLDGNLAASYKDLASHQALLIRNLPASTGDGRDVGLIPGLGRSPEKEMATHSSILAWRILWTEEPGWLLSMGWQSRT